MRLRIVCLGKTRSREIRALMEDYRSRIAHFTSIELVEWKATGGGPRVLTDARGRDSTAPVVLLDPAGKEFTSDEFARWLARQMNTGRRTLVFVLGGAEGFEEETRHQADTLLSLSKMTLPHELARVVLLEQLYRAFALLREHPYPR